MKVIAIVPALDEALHVGAVVSGLRSRGVSVMVIDDGSTDATSDVARSAGAEVVRHETPRGVGAAIAAGMARAHDADAAVVLAGDGQMDVRDLPALLGPIARGEADVVKGNRLAWPEGALAFPLVRLLGVVGLAAATRVATGLRVDDAQCGYVAVGRRALREIPWARLWPSFGYPNDLLSRVARLGLRLAEVPVRPVYGAEQSKLRARHVPGIAFVVGRALAARMRGHSPPRT